MPRRENKETPYYSHPFAKWLRVKRKAGEDFHRLSKKFDIPITTMYNWAAGVSLPSGKYLSIYDYFLKDKNRNKLMVLVTEE